MRLVYQENISEYFKPLFFGYNLPIIIPNHEKGAPHMALPLIDDFRTVVTHRRPLIDTRAPVEFAKGSFPGAVNLPLMNDEERTQVGTTYKRQGNAAAVALGHRLVSGEVKAARIRAWTHFIDQHPDGVLFCWRGGQRSQIVQEWLHEAGYTVPRLQGGYKAFRTFLIEESLRLAQAKETLILGGRTGSGKTLLLHQLPGTIDLEGLANHRGSSFGRYATPQPSQIDFENALAYAQIAHDDAGHRRLIIEDESRNIGRCYIPDGVFDAFQAGKVVLLEVPLEERITITYDEYILAAQADYAQAHAQGHSPYTWIEVMEHNFKRIRKRLGDKNYRELSAMLNAAWKHQEQTGDPTQHREWIEALLVKYYDPMYDYQLERKAERIVFRGDKKAVMEFVQEEGA
jgi:tRNA 2-selenouridine synthase